MITASELGMLCAKHRIKNASWLTESARSWFTPKSPTPPEINLTKDQKPQAQPNPYAKASEQPFNAAKGLPKGLPKANPIQPVQTAAKPQYSYYNPPTGNTKTEIKPYEYFKDLYKDYPGGYQGAIDDSQHWQDDAESVGLPTWKPENLHKPVEVRTGSFVAPWESRQSGLKRSFGQSRGFTDPNTPDFKDTVMAYRTNNANNFGFGNLGNRSAIIVNPTYSPENASTEIDYRATLGHELTHQVHGDRYNRDPRNMVEKALGMPRPNVYTGNEHAFTTHANGSPISDREKQYIKYTGEPTEFGAHLSELRRHWIENNPGKRIRMPRDAEELLQRYNYLHNPEQPTPTVNDLQRFLPNIMYNPELKRKAIIQILSSVVQNKQKQAPGTNV